MALRHWISTLIFLGLLSRAHGAGEPYKIYTVDVGTGLGIYLEIPGSADMDRPFRIVYDTGKGQGEGTDNDLVKFLTSAKIGLKPASDEFGGDVIDYFILSHPHEDHFNGARPLFDSFEVRNVIESKQIAAVKYLTRFKASAIAEIKALKDAGVDAHYYVVGLPYPNGFDQDRDGEAYDEYEIANGNLPKFMKEKIDARAFSGKVTWPFGPDQVSQTVDWPMSSLLAANKKALELLPAAYRRKKLEVDILPVGTRFELGRKAWFVVLHADTIAAFDPKKIERADYAAAFPYYTDSDLNDGSVSIHVQMENSSLMIPGDTEGREAKPTTLVKLTDIFGSGEEADTYTPEDINEWLRVDQPEAKRFPILDMAKPYIVSSFDIGRLAYFGYVPFNDITPAPVETTVGSKELKLPAKEYSQPSDIDPSVVSWEKRSELQKQNLHPQWQERLFSLHGDLKLNRQKLDALRSRFKGWTTGSKPRLKWSSKDKDFLLEWEKPVWSVVNLVQVTEALYYVDPALAQIFAGMIIRSDLFLDYMNPKEPERRSLRGEKHMIHVADQIQAESGTDVLKSDVLWFGHHGSFTSSSIGFIKRVDPNVGIISADDKSYSGSTLPDFSSLFWNMNTRHARARAILHSIFFHADVLARKRGETFDEKLLDARFSPSASRVFIRRERWPIPIWRTDWNDDLIDRNTLEDNILIVTDGTKPIWGWSRAKGRSEESQDPFAHAVSEGLKEDPSKFPYWSLELISARPHDMGEIRPTDPSGEMSTFRLQVGQEEAASGARILSAPPVLTESVSTGLESADTAASMEEEAYEPEDWVLREGE